MTDLLVRGALAVAGEEPERLDVAIADGRIAALGPELAGPARAELDARGLHLLPGVIDPHLHFDDPGRARLGGLRHRHRGARGRRTTTSFDMPLNSIPPTVDGRAPSTPSVPPRAGRAHCDFGLWGGLCPATRHELAGLAARGVVGFKAFMSATGVDEFRACGDDDLYAGHGARPPSSGCRSRSTPRTTS